MSLGMSRGAPHGSMFSVGRILCTILRHVHSSTVPILGHVTERLFKYAQLVSIGYASKEVAAEHTNVEDVVCRPAPSVLGTSTQCEFRGYNIRGTCSETAETKGGPSCSQCPGLQVSSRYHYIDALHPRTSRP